MSGTGPSRVPCCVPECRRSFKPSVAALEHDHDEIMCGRCYRTVEARLIARHKAIHRRWRRAERLLSVKAISPCSSFDSSRLILWQWAAPDQNGRVNGLAPPEVQAVSSASASESAVSEAT